MKNIRRLSMVFVIVALLFVSPAAEAFLGFGDIVFDPSVFMQTLMSYFTEIEDYANQAEQLSNQVQSLMNEAQNLANMDQNAAGRTLSNITGSLQKLKDLKNNVRGITMDYMNLRSPNVQDRIEDGHVRVINSPLRLAVPGRPHPARWLAGQLYRVLGLGYLLE